MGRIAWGIGCALVLALAWASPPGQRVEATVGLPLLHALRGPVPVPPGVAILGLDQAGIDWLQFWADDLGQVAPDLAACLGPGPRAALGRMRHVGDLPRALHGCVIEALMARGAALVVFDILFAVETPDDAALAAAMARSGRVALFERLRPRDTGGAGPAAMQRVHPLPEVARAAAGTGAFLVAMPAGGIATGYLTRFDGFPDLAPLSHTAWRLGGGTVPDLPTVQPIWFYGPARSVPTLTLRQLFGQDGGAVDLAGRVVFVGVSDPGVPGLPDHFAVPVGAAPMGGVEVMATAWANLAQGVRLSAPGAPAAAGAVAAFGLALGLACRALGGVVAALALPLGWGAVAAGAFAWGQVWLPLAVPLGLGVPLGLALALAHRSAAARRLVARLVPRQIARALLRQPRAERRAMAFEPATILITDIAGSTTLGDRLSAAQYAAAMNHYYDTVTAAIEAEGGMVVEFTGDGVMGLFPVGVSGPDHAARACAAARRLARDLDACGPPPGLDAGQALRLRMGLHTGPTATGDIGARHRYTYKALGDTVNVAARLEQQARDHDPGSGHLILLSGATVAAAALAPGQYRAIGPVTLRGKGVAMQVAILHP